MAYTLTEASRATRKDKTTLLRAIRAGRVSAVRDHRGGWLIEPAELHRVYPLGDVGAVVRDAPCAHCEGLRARLDDAQATIADLRRRLDSETEERRRLTAVLADQRPASRRWWPWRGR